MSNSIHSKTKSSKFSHNFSGYSVWIEPSRSESDAIVQEMKYLASKCGGAPNGVHDFSLHCTLLYNFNPSECIKGIEVSEEEICRELLVQCFKEYKAHVKSELGQDCVELDPKKYYFFSYPKEADDGRGFGCVIPMLILKNNSNLQRIHDTVARVFPPDERHSNNGRFIPHMALCYGPEIYEDDLRDYIAELENKKQHLIRKPMIGEYLSVWKTQGSLKDWKLVHRISLLKPS